MSEDINSADVDNKIESVIASIEAEEQKKNQPEQDSAQPEGEALEEAAPEEVSGEDEAKSKPEGEVEPAEDGEAIDPPASWPSEDKEAFKSLPKWAQERIAQRERERDSHFTQRSMELSARQREIGDAERKASEATARYAAELEKLNQISAQLMPAKFSDIQNEADYIRLKREDPARASEYDAFVMTLRNSAAERERLAQSQMQDRLNQEWSQLVSRFPEFTDQTKAKVILDDVRKTCVENYGFAPQEVANILDHRYVPIIRDAMAWRAHQINVKTAEAKKVAPQPKRVIRTESGSTASTGEERRSAILNRARNTDNLNKKADMIAALLAQGA